jgi:hypothetical protein
MVKTADPILEVFRKRDDAAFRELYMQTMEREAAERTATGARKAKKNAKGKGKAKAARETKEVCS